MSTTAVAIAILAAAGVLVFLLLAIVVVGGSKPRPKPPTGPPPTHDADDLGPIFEPAARRQAERLRAELDDPQACEKWLRGERP